MTEPRLARHVVESYGLTVLCALWFYFVYGSADYITSLHSFRIRLHFNWEPALPFVPELVVVYESIYFLFAMAPFVLRTRREVVALAVTNVIAISVAGICFMMFPAQEIFPASGELGYWTQPVALAKRLALTFNFAPSLHVALPTICVLVFSPHIAPSWKWMIWVWIAAISLSTLLFHQHYIVDVITGWLLAWLAVRLIYDRLIRS